QRSAALAQIVNRSCFAPFGADTAFQVCNCRHLECFMISKGTITMPCFLALLVLLFPRIAIILLYLFTNFFRGVYDSLLLPVLGFIFLPFTLLAYTTLVNMHQPHDTTFLV